MPPQNPQNPENPRPRPTGRERAEQARERITDAVERAQPRVNRAVEAAGPKLEKAAETAGSLLGTLRARAKEAASAFTDELNDAERKRPEQRRRPRPGPIGSNERNDRPEEQQ